MDWNCRTLLTIGLLTAAHSCPGWSYPTPVDFDGRLLRWNIDASSPPITWAIETDQPDAEALFETFVNESAAIWSEVGNSYLRLAKAEPGTTPHITIKFLDTIVGGESAAGYAAFDESDASGPIHCAVHIAAPGSEEWSNLAKTTLHELGHCLGLGHSLIPESIMSYELERNSFRLALDDEAAIARLYPIDGSQPKLPPGCAISGTTSIERTAIWLLVLLLMPLVCVTIGLWHTNQSTPSHKRH